MTTQQEKYIPNKISVIGAGEIGPDICLHFAQSFAKEPVQHILVDISEDALAKANKRISSKLAKAQEKGKITAEKSEKILNSITFTTDYDLVKGSNIVVEAATENEDIKDMIFRQVEALCDDDTLFLSNSSHMQPEVIFRNIQDKSRCLVAHYFFPADRNPVVEVVPGKDTSPEVAEHLMGFYRQIRKKPVKVKSSYGYAVDPVFEGLCQTAVYCLEQGYGNEKEIDKAAAEALGMGVGPFIALNLTGGNPITNHGLDEMNEKLLPWFKSPALLRKAVEENSRWNTAGRGEVVELDAEKEKRLSEQFKGAYFALTSFIADLDIIDRDDFNSACETALVIKPPYTMMNEIGIENAYSLVRQFCDEHKDFPFPKSLETALKEGGWRLKSLDEQQMTV